MSFNPAPSSWLGAGYSLDTGTHEVRIRDSQGTNPVALELTDAEGHVSTGDVRKVMFALVEALYAKWAATAAVDRPTKMTLSRTSLENTDGKLVRSYNFQFILDIAGTEVTAE